ncbi:MAG TPA: hypothetical protein VGI00_00815 [Streptosporangiaceae bacterium]
MAADVKGKSRPTTVWGAPFGWFAAGAHRVRSVTTVLSGSPGRQFIALPPDRDAAAAADP